MNLSAARAEFYPDVSINALLGVQSVDVAKLLRYGSRVPEIGAALHLPLFDEGRLRAEYGAARASIDAAISTYQDTVVTAAREVASEATTLAQLEAQRDQRLLEVSAARRIMDSQTARVAQGLADARAELDAEQTLIEQRDALLQLDGAKISADVALKRALGGGYQSPSISNSSAAPVAASAKTTRP
jgi:multidrug efflux system outer membrane protein